MRWNSIFIVSLISIACAGNTRKDAALKQARASNEARAKEASKQAVSIEAKLAAAEKNSSQVTEVVFGPGSKVLSRPDVIKIAAALAAAEAKKSLRHVTILAWSDLEMGAAPEAPPNEAQQELATGRGEAIKVLVQRRNAKLPVEILNMARAPGKLSEFLRTDEVRIRDALRHATPSAAKASHAVLIMEATEE